jgi:DNA helicase HerA-like ATPase
VDLSNVRIKEHFGIVTNNTSTSQLGFLISPPKNRESMEKEDIICLDHPKYGDACQVLAEINEITIYEEVAGSTVGERIGRLQATALVIGFFDLRSEHRPLQKLLIPPHPGSRIYMPYAEFLEDLFSRGAEGKPYKTRLHLGKTEIAAASKEAGYEQLDFFLDSDDLTSKNTLISAVDGVGKTYTAKVVIEELANKTSCSIVVIDPSNEYAAETTASEKNQARPLDFQKVTINLDGSKSSEDLIIKKIRQNQLVTITGENLMLEEKNKSYSTILNALASCRRQKTTPPFVLIVEDAENLSPQAIQENLPLKNSATVLITSHPSMLGGETLSKMQSQIIGRTTDPEDMKYLQNVIGNTHEQLPSLSVGEMIISGLNVVRPTKIHIRQRLS